MQKGVDRMSNLNRRGFVGRLMAALGVGTVLPEVLRADEPFASLGEQIRAIADASDDGGFMVAPEFAEEIRRRMKYTDA